MVLAPDQIDNVTGIMSLFFLLYKVCRLLHVFLKSETVYLKFVSPNYENN